MTTTQLRRDRLAANGITVIDSRDRRRLARSLVLGGVHYDAGHSCGIVSRPSRRERRILIDGKEFTVASGDLMR